MSNSNDNKGYIFKCGGNELAKVLYYYGLIFDVKSEQKIVCPFHEDMNPSMVINLNEGSYFCFGCGKAGDALSFVREVNPQMNELQACKEYFKILKSKKAGSINYRKLKSTKRGKYSKRLYDEAYDYYHGLRTPDWKYDDEEEVEHARDYMLKRGFSLSALKRCKAKITYNKAYQIIFPMFDNGKFKGWVCRTTQPRIEKKRKYLYNEGFNRKNTLVGEYRNCKTVFIVEGYMDRLKFVQYGVYNVVAILGWKISDKQMAKLKNLGIEHVISALDNDKCGRKGTEFLKKHFKVTRFAYLKGIKDPGEMNRETFNKCYRRTMAIYNKESRTSSKE